MRFAIANKSALFQSRLVRLCRNLIMRLELMTSTNFRVAFVNTLL